MVTDDRRSAVMCGVCVCVCVLFGGGYVVGNTRRRRGVVGGGGDDEVGGWVWRVVAIGDGAPRGTC